MKFQEAYKQLISLSNLQTTNYSSSKKELEASLRRTKKLLTLLGSPERKMTFIHITGTSGKGSTAYMMHEILRQSGKRVGTYLSPHTTSYLERFLFQDKLIRPQVVIDGIQDLTAAYKKLLALESPMSFFELSTVLAIYAMQKAGASYMVLEVGCGGRWDATNIIPAPAVAIITNIGKDHTRLLGNSLKQIAFEKAGIIKKGSFVVCGEPRTALRKIFQAEAEKLSVPITFLNAPTSQLVPPELGDHQQMNASLAEKAAQQMQIEQKAIDSALMSIHPLPCRFETISRRPHIIVDGAHSRAKMHTTAEMIKKLDKHVHILIGHSADKPGKAFIDLLAPLAKKIHTTRFTTSVRKAANPVALAALVPKPKRGEIHLDPIKALKTIKKTLTSKDVLIVTGSLYLAGEIRSHFIPEMQIIEQRSSFPAKTRRK
jgi:dihydrofolate synthase / folylpolyglutamate synthase